LAVEIKHATLTSELGGSKVGATEWDEAHIVPVASQAEAEAGTNDSKLMTPERTAQAILALAPGGGGGSVDWGDIGGTLSAQTDLATALAGKQAAGSYLVASDLAPYATTSAVAAGYQPLASVLTNTTASFTTALNTKLSGIATGATANDTDANLKNRANHTGTQAVSTILAASSSRFFGRITASGGAGEELTGAQATTLLDTFTSALKGLAPASGGGTSNFLRADGTWAAPAAGGASFTQIGSTYTVGSAVANITFTGINAEDLLIHYLGLSNTAAGVANLTLSVSINGGSSWVSPASGIHSMTGGAATHNGLTSLSGLKTGLLQVLAPPLDSGTVRLISGSGFQTGWIIPGGAVNAIRFTMSDGSNFDAGSIKVFGRG